MDDVPEALLSEIFEYVPRRAHLPICHVSRRFRSSWLGRDGGASPGDAGGEGQGEGQGEGREPRSQGLLVLWAGAGDQGSAGGRGGASGGAGGDSRRRTSPLQIGNLFRAPWNRPGRGTLNTSLLGYYVENGWGGRDRLRRVAFGAAARGDIEGMEYLFDRDLYPQDDPDVCTSCAAAGQLEALIWLREVRGCPWDPTEVHRESSENSQEGVVDYVEQHAQGHEIQTVYGVGLPW
jgi:hypothetical protein